MSSNNKNNNYEEISFEADSILKTSYQFIEDQNAEKAKKATISKALDYVYKGIAGYRNIAQHFLDEADKTQKHVEVKHWNNRIQTIEGYQKALMSAMKDLRELYGFDFISLHAELLNENAKRQTKRQDNRPVDRKDNTDNEHTTRQTTS